MYKNKYDIVASYRKEGVESVRRLFLSLVTSKSFYLDKKCPVRWNDDGNVRGETEKNININEEGKQIHLVADNFHGWLLKIPSIERTF